MRYFFDIVDKGFLHENVSNAASKPRTDTIATMVETGLLPLLVALRWWIPGCPRTLKQKIWRKLHLAQMGWNYRQLKHKLTPSDEVLMQYPFFVPEAKALMMAVKESGAKLTVLVHDCYLIRERRPQDVMEQWILKFADKVIVHSEPMKTFCEEISRQMEPNDKVPTYEVLEMFDYRLSDKPEVKATESAKTVIFAGNLSKAGFVKELSKLPVEFSLYGLPKLDSKSYQGAFDGNNPEGLVGDFGLVWDGDSLDTCKGLMGDYLRYNAPFKFSLYLALGLPVIVWSQSAMATYVEQYHLGICVDSLHEIAPKLEALSAEEILAMRQGAERMGEKIRKGQMLKSIIS